MALMTNTNRVFRGSLRQIYFKQWKLEAVESDVEINAFGNMLKGITNFQNPSELFQIFGSLYVTFPWKTL